MHSKKKRVFDAKKDLPSIFTLLIELYIICPAKARGCVLGCHRALS